MQRVLAHNELAGRGFFVYHNGDVIIKECNAWRALPDDDPRKAQSAAIIQAFFAKFRKDLDYSVFAFRDSEDIRRLSSSCQVKVHQLIDDMRKHLGEAVHAMDDGDLVDFHDHLEKLVKTGHELRGQAAEHLRTLLVYEV